MLWPLLSIILVSWHILLPAQCNGRDDINVEQAYQMSGLSWSECPFLQDYPYVITKDMTRGREIGGIRERERDGGIEMQHGRSVHAGHKIHGVAKGINQSEWSKTENKPFLNTATGTGFCLISNLHIKHTCRQWGWCCIPLARNRCCLWRNMSGLGKIIL